MRGIFAVFFLLFCSLAVFSQEIQWVGDVTSLPGPGKYARMVLMKQGPKAGQILLTYQQRAHGRIIVKRYSADSGKTWSAKDTILMIDANGWTYANCNIIELEDGRLLMTYQKRQDESIYTGRDRLICVKFSSDGGNTWSQEKVIFQGGNWEPMPIQVKNDKDGDGHGDIYIFFTLQDIYPTYYTEEQCKQGNELGGRCVSLLASYDNGTTWTKLSDERYGARMLLRDYKEASSSLNYRGSAGGMPTPFVTSDNRFGFIAESIDRLTSPWVVLAPPGDYDFQSSYFNGSWQTVNYNGSNDNNVYPTDSYVRWSFTGSQWGGAPFALVLPNGKIAFSYNSGRKIYCWVADSHAKNPVQVARPFADSSTFYSSMINLNDSMILITAHQYEPDMAKLFFRQGKIKRETTTDLSKAASDSYKIMYDGDGFLLEGLKGDEKIRLFTLSGMAVPCIPDKGRLPVKVVPGVYLLRITGSNGESTLKKISVTK